MLNYSSYAIDSRLVEPGGCFFAIKGEKTDGHAYLRQVADREGVAAVVEKGYTGDDFGLDLIRVEDVTSFLQDAARQRFRLFDFEVIGVTGSLGKTTLKEFIAGVLGEKLKVFKSPASYNSQMTLPLCVLNCPRTCDVAVFEYAMSDKGQIQKLIDIAPPTIGVMGPIDFVHAENFLSLQEIAFEKSRLFTSSQMKRGFVHKNAWDLVRCIGDFEKQVFGDLKLEHLHDHLAENADCAIKIAQYFGLSEEEITRGVLKLRPVQNRGEIVKREGAIYYNDSYNANVTSFRAAFAAVPKPQSGKLIAVIGSMGELGDFSKSCHEKVGEMAKACDHVLCLGDPCTVICEMLGSKAHLCENFETLQDRLKTLVQPGDSVLIKGSNVHRLWRLV